MPPKPFNCNGTSLGVQLKMSAPEVGFETSFGGSTGGKTGGGGSVGVGVNDVSSNEINTELLNGVVMSS